MLRFIRFSARWFWRAILLLVLLANLRLYAPSPLAPDHDQLPVSLIAQLNANRIAIDSGAGNDMQNFFPEGFYFCHALHGLTWVEAALRDPSQTQHAIAQAKLAVAALESQDGKAPFPVNLPPDHGMFYCAWKADLQAGIALLTDGKDLDQLQRLRTECDEIAKSLAAATTPFLASYIGSAWPCDTFPAIHALVVYDRVTQEDRYAATVAKWLSDVHQRLDSTTGLVSHTSSLPDGNSVSIARATSQVIILRFLADIDPEFAKEQYTTFRDKFLTTFFGIPSVLEYPKGVRGQGDVDSGPLIFGRSLSATVLMMGAAQIYGDIDQAHAIAQAGEVVGLPWTSGEKKRYVGGVLPVGDIIVAYSHVARPWFSTTEHVPQKPIALSRFWRWKTHAASLCFVIPTVFRIWRRRKSHSDNGEDEMND